MGQFVSLVLFIAVLAFISVYLDRRWQARKQEQAESGEVTEGKTSKIGDWFKSIGNKLKFKKASNLTEQFQNWVKDTKLDKGLKTWLESLDENETKVLVRGLSTFCAKLDLDLAWLGQSVLDGEADIKKVLETSVISYCTTQWSAVQANEDVTLLKTWLAVQEKPNKKKHQQLYKKLFVALLDKKLIKTDLNDYVNASSKEQNKLAVEFVNKAAEENRKAFNTVLKEVLATDDKEEETSKETKSSEAAPAAASA